MKRIKCVWTNNRNWIAGNEYTATVGGSTDGAVIVESERENGGWELTKTGESQWNYIKSSLPSAGFTE